MNSLMAIIFFALYPLSPMKRMWESVRHLLAVILKGLNDEHFIGWLCANPDDPRGVACIERCLDDFNAVIDLMIYLEARAILGLPPASWRRPRLPPAQRRRTRTFAELLARAEACALRLADIERLAQRRAQKLARLLDPSEVRLDAPAGPIARICAQDGLPRRSAAKAGGSSRGGSLNLRAGLRVRAPP